jgi:glycosyltransferase involved in cell wall biosynthesis
MSKKTKIIILNNFFTGYGGAEKALLNISSIIGQIYEIFHFSVNKKPYFIENYPYSSYFPEYFDYRKLSLSNIKRIFKIFYNFEAKQNLEKMIDKINPDFAFIHNIHYHLTCSVVDACKEKKLPVILFLHDPRFFCPAGMLCYGDTYCSKEFCIKGNPINCIVHKCKQGNLKGSILSALNFLFIRSKNVLDKADAIICPSRAIYELAVRSGAKKEKLHVINHFIDKKSLETKAEYSNNNYFLYVGRLDREKGVHFLLSAMKSLPKNIALHIVGTGSESQNLQNQAAELNLSTVKFLGYLEGKELENEYKNCIATIQPCNWFETFGLTVIESFLYGKPVIASSIGAIPEIIENDKNGILFEPANIEQLGKAIKYLHNNPKKAYEYGKNGREKVETDYNSEIFLEKFTKLITAQIIQQN